jgi:hypothetical protein
MSLFPYYYARTVGSKTIFEARFRVVEYFLPCSKNDARRKYVVYDMAALATSCFLD